MPYIDYGVELEKSEELIGQQQDEQSRLRAAFDPRAIRVKDGIRDREQAALTEFKGRVEALPEGLRQARTAAITASDAQASAGRSFDILGRVERATGGVNGRNHS